MTDSLTSQEVLRVLLAQQRALERIADALERAYPKPKPQAAPIAPAHIGGLPQVQPVDREADAHRRPGVQPGEHGLLRYSEGVGSGTRRPRLWSWRPAEHLTHR